MTRADLPGLGRVYGLEVGVPLLLMLAGAGLGRWIGDGWPAAGLFADLARLTLAGLFALAVGGVYLGWRHRESARAALTRRRTGREARSAA